MKKQYRIITVVINLLLLVLFVVLEGIGENDLASDEDTVHVHEWIKQIDNTDLPEDIDKAFPGSSVASYHAVVETKYEKKMCDEAKKKLEEVIDKVEKGYVIKTNNDGSISYSGHDDINERMEMER